MADYSHWLIALRAPTLTGAKLSRAVTELGDVKALFSLGSEPLRQLAISAKAQHYLRHPDQDQLQSDLDWLARPNHHLIPITHPDYPSLLKKIPGPPAALYVVGDPGLLWQPQLGIVGSRNPTGGGRDNALAFSRHLAAAGFTITSGLADGIDSVAHRGALDGGGSTIAVLGTGADLVYPGKNRNLAADISAAGALVTEFNLGAEPRRSHFPARNRIISGLCLGVLVVEAGVKSGSLITARLAAEQGREVFAIPGSIHNPMARGCHKLIRQGARLVETAEHVRQELSSIAAELAMDLKQQLDAADPAPLEGEDSAPNIAEVDQMDPEYRRLWDSLGYDPMAMDTLIEQTGLNASAVSSMLLMLELRGMVEAHHGGAYSRKK